MQALLAQVTKEKQRLDRPGTLDLDTCKQGESVTLGSGAINTVELVIYQPPGQQGLREGVFKPNSTVIFPPHAEVIGIDESNPRWPERNVATYRLNEALGLQVIPTTSFAILKGKDGVVMDRAKGYSPFTTGTVNVPLTKAQMKYLSKHPKTANNLALEQGFKSATLVGNTLKFDPGSEEKASSRSTSRTRSCDESSRT